MRIGEVCHRFYPHIGGVPTYVQEVSERLAKRGFDIQVLTTDPSGELPHEERINNVVVKRFRSWAPNNAYYISTGLKRYLVKNSDNYDIIHAYSYSDFPALYAAQAKHRNKLVFNPVYHGTGSTWFRKLLHIPYGFVGKKIFARSDKLICNSNYERRLVLKHFRVDKRNVSVIPPGVNLAEFNGIERHRKESRTMLCVARLERYKGIQYLIKVLPMLDKDIVLDVVGSGPYGGTLVRLATELGVEQRVNFSQDLSRGELLEKYAGADLFILLSKHETYGISIAEALASGASCIVANGSALEEWVDNSSCYGVDYPIDPEELAALIRHTIRKPPKGPRLRDWHDTAEGLAKVYVSVMTDSARATPCPGICSSSIERTRRAIVPSVGHTY